MDDLERLDDPIAQQALGILQPLLLAPILHHSLRTFLLASAECRASRWDEVPPEDLLIACLFHDSGTISDDSPERFEVVGADRATEFARNVGRPEVSCRAIWDAVALHTSPGIAERHQPLTRAVRIGVLADFGSAAHAYRHRALIPQLEQRFPRDGIERVLADAVVQAAHRTPAKAPPASWPADLVRGAQDLTDPRQENPCF